MINLKINQPLYIYWECVHQIKKYKMVSFSFSSCVGWRRRSKRCCCCFSDRLTLTKPRSQNYLSTWLICERHEMFITICCHQVIQPHVREVGRVLTFCIEIHQNSCPSAVIFLTAIRCREQLEVIRFFFAAFLALFTLVVRAKTYKKKSIYLKKTGLKRGQGF